LPPWCWLPRGKWFRGRGWRGAGESITRNSPPRL